MLSNDEKTKDHGLDSLHKERRAAFTQLVVPFLLRCRREEEAIRVTSSKF
jgi:hypothetical protein